MASPEHGSLSRLEGGALAGDPAAAGPAPPCTMRNEVARAGGFADAPSMHERLDNAVYHALTTRHAHLATQHARAARYPVEVSPLAGLAEPSQLALADLARIVPAGAAVGVIDIEHLAPFPPDVWQPVGEPLLLTQMVCEEKLAPSDLETSPLGANDADEMLRLVDETQPGPFLRRTVEMGRYVGVREGEQLIAMAGERLALPGYTEVSAVCTAPAFRGRGLGEGLVRCIGAAIQGAGDVPFLHVLEENVGAIALYEKLGFRRRRTRPLRILLRVAPAEPRSSPR